MNRFNNAQLVFVETPFEIELYNLGHSFRPLAQIVFLKVVNDADVVDVLTTYRVHTPRACLLVTLIADAAVDCKVR